MPAIVRLEETINRTLPDGWQVKVTSTGRFLYLNHSSKVSQWLPPVECWPLKTNLPYGWEEAVTEYGKKYYISHLKCITTSCHPYILQVGEPPPTRRLVTLQRDDTHGFGFIAGSESPVVVRSVTENGPSSDKLLPEDHILEINGEDVTKSKRLYIIDMIMSATDAVQLLVSQPDLNKDGIKSGFLSHNKKQRLMARPLKVRFATNIRTFSPNTHKVPASLSYLPNILKVYLENGQTKSFRYDGNTTVKVVLENISTKLGIERHQHFALVTEDVRLNARQRFNILCEDMTLRQVSSQPDSQYWRCLYRMTFPPKDSYELLLHDSAAFDYFYHQCRNDVICERFGDELKFDLALRLASLNIQQHMMRVNKKSMKVSVKMLQKQDGLELFLPRSILETHKGKELRKQLCFHLKQNQSFTPPGQKCLSEVQAKLHYLKIIAELKLFSCRNYCVTCGVSDETDTKTECEIIVNPRIGICKVEDKENEVYNQISDFKGIEALVLSRQPMVKEDTVNAVCQVELIKVDGQKFHLVTTEADGTDFSYFVSGLYKIYVNDEKKVLSIDNSRFIQDPSSGTPVYLGEHRVLPAGWNYPDVDDYPIYETEEDTDLEYLIDLTEGPPTYDSVLNRNSDELSLPRTDGSDSDEVALSFDSDDASEEPKNTDNGAAAVLTDTEPIAQEERDEEDTGSVVSLTDMSFDIREPTEDSVKQDEDDGIAQLLFILQDDFKEGNNVQDVLDGTAKLRKSRSVGDLIDRRPSVDSFSSESSSVRSLCLSELDHSFRNHDIFWHNDDAFARSRRSSSATCHNLSESSSIHSPIDNPVLVSPSHNEEDEEDDEIPVSMIDIPSPDPVSSPEVFIEFDIPPRTPDLSEEADSAIAKPEIDDDNLKDGGDLKEGEETLESIAASFKAEDHPIPEEQICAISNKADIIENESKKTESTADKESPNVADVEESLDALAESFRVDQIKKVGAHKDPVVKTDEGRTKTSLKGLVQALIAVSHVVDHRQFSNSKEEDDAFRTSDENGNHKSMLTENKVVSSATNDEVDEKDNVLSLPELELLDKTEVNIEDNIADKEGNPSKCKDTSQDELTLVSTYKSEDMVLVKDLMISSDETSVETEGDGRKVLGRSKAGQDEEGVRVETFTSARDVDEFPQNNDEKEPSESCERENSDLVKLVSLKEKANNEVSFTQMKSPCDIPLPEEEISHPEIDGGKHAGIASPEEEKNERTSPSRFQPQLLDEAHGIQLAALLALDASMEDKEAVNPRVPLLRDEEGSDSGNETIASECADGPSSEQPNSLIGVDAPMGAEAADASVAVGDVCNTFYDLAVEGDVDAGSHGLGVAIDHDTLASMQILLSVSAGTEDVETLSEHREGTPSDLSKELEQTSNEDQNAGQVTRDESPKGLEQIDFLIASLTVQPPPGFDDTLDEDTLVITPPPCFDDGSHGCEVQDLPDKHHPLDATGDVKAPSSKSSLASKRDSRDTDAVPGHELESNETPAEAPPIQPPRRKRMLMFIPPPEVAPKNKIIHNNGLQEDGEKSTPTPPPRRRFSRKSSSDSPGHPNRGNKDGSSVGETGRVKKPLQRSATFTLGEDDSTGDQRLNSGNGNVPSGKLLQDSPSSSPRNRHNLIGDSISKVFSPVRSWSSFKESIILRATKSRPRTSLKSLWPKTSSGEADDEEVQKCQSMEDILGGLDEEVVDDDFAAPMIREKLNSTLRRSESVGGSLQKKITDEMIPDVKTCETVVLQQEFWRKAGISTPPPRRPAPPVPGHPALSKKHGSLQEVNIVTSQVNVTRSVESDFDEAGGDSETWSPTPPPLRCPNLQRVQVCWRLNHHHFRLGIKEPLQKMS
ncbi:hypothetical protein BSL78_23723 [Apostichopus japonicus]|uniref:FERM and PDZ domain-containing protein 4 n=1 Tax=Stichopus japonicus TaxID=307972 RepID=A0A2G8JUJ3_STIJA|nr:hypothetical protein BSL78_23723 [Apostichopus japonicus]